MKYILSSFIWLFTYSLTYAQQTRLESSKDDIITLRVTEMGSGSFGGAIYGESESGFAIRGYSRDYRGVYGSSTSSFGVYGGSTSSSGVYGRSDQRHGVHGRSVSLSGTSRGVLGEADAGVGVYGQSDSGVGIYGTSSTNIGIVADADDTNDFDIVVSNSDGSKGYGSISSIRWKTDIRSIPDPLALVTRLRGVYFTWKENPETGEDIGFIAEEVGQVLPSIVGYEENGVDAVGLDYSKMTPLLVEATKAMRIEYQERFEEQQNEVDRLKEQVSELYALKHEMAELRKILSVQLKNTSDE